MLSHSHTDQVKTNGNHNNGGKTNTQTPRGTGEYHPGRLVYRQERGNQGCRAKAHRGKTALEGGAKYRKGCTMGTFWLKQSQTPVRSYTSQRSTVLMRYR